MQYAQIVVNSKTTQREIFTYSIPPELLPQIRLGILVLVPFRGRQIEGVIVDIKKKKPPQLNIGQIKKIKAILDPNPVVDESRLKLAQWMSDYYLGSLGETLFYNLVPAAKRVAKNLKISDQPPKPKSYQPFSKPILLFAPYHSRLHAYKKILKKLKPDQQAIILVPDLAVANYFLESLTSHKISFIHSNLTLTKRYTEWLNIRQGKTNIILGSISALFAPAQNLKLIIIDQEENDAYFFDRSPYFHASKVARKLAELTGAKLILGSSAPTIESFYETKLNQFQLIKGKFSPIKAEIVDLNNQNRIISWELEQAISQTLIRQGKIILFINRKGVGRILICRDCQNRFLCPNCAVPLIPTKNQLICHHCSTKTTIPTRCPHCHGTNLAIFGLTTERAKTEIKRLFPKARILRLEKQTKEEFFLDLETLHRLEAGTDIIIGTSYIIKSLVKKADLVGIVLAEQNLNFGDFRAGERVFQLTSKILHLGRKSIIQTFIPEHPIIKLLAKNDYEGFFNYEMKHRREHLFPPLVSILKILIKHQNQEKVRQKTKKFYRILKKSLSKKLFQLNPPVAPTLAKRHNQYQYNIIIKFPKDLKINQYLPEPPTGVTYQRDPASEIQPFCFNYFALCTHH